MFCFALSSGGIALVHARYVFSCRGSRDTVVVCGIYFMTNINGGVCGKIYGMGTIA